MSEGTLVVTAGDPCDPESEPSVSISSATRKFMGFGLPFLGAVKYGGFGTAALTMGFLMATPTSVSAQSTSDCQVIPIDVEIYIDATVEEIVNKQYKAGEYEVCPRESKSLSAFIPQNGSILIVCSAILGTSSRSFWRLQGLRG